MLRCMGRKLALVVGGLQAQVAMSLQVMPGSGRRGSQRVRSGTVISRRRLEIEVR